MPISDTSPEARDVQIALLREAGTARRLALTFDVSSSTIRASRRAIAERHPELDEVGVKLLWAELHYGKELTDKVRACLARRHE